MLCALITLVSQVIIVEARTMRTKSACMIKNINGNGAEIERESYDAAGGPDKSCLIVGQGGQKL